MVKLFGYKTSFSALYRLNYQFVWSTRMRIKVLTGQLGIELREIIKEICTRERYEILSLEILQDHVAILLGLPPKESPSTAIKKIKGITARKILLNNPNLKNKILVGSLWSEKYFVGTVGRVTDETIREYIAGQKTLKVPL